MDLEIVRTPSTDLTQTARPRPERLTCHVRLARLWRPAWSLSARCEVCLMPRRLSSWTVRVPATVHQQDSQRITVLSFDEGKLTATHRRRAAARLSRNRSAIPCRRRRRSCAPELCCSFNSSAPLRGASWMQSHRRPNPCLPRPYRRRFRMIAIPKA